MGIKNRAQHLFNAVKDHELQKRVAMVSTDVKVDAGEVMVFRNYLDDIGLMIPVSDDQFASFRSDTRSATLRLTSQHVDDAPHIRLALSEPRQEKIFAVFVDEILSALEVDPSTPGGTVSIMLKRWRELFKESRQPIVWTREQDLGLLCELEVLDALYHVQTPDLMRRWTGPEGLPHDFELSSESLECKSTSSMNGLRVSINGIPQLNPTTGKDLRLIVRSYADSPDGSLSVLKMIDKILDLDDLDTDVFIEKLQKMGCPAFEIDAETYFGRFDPVESFEFQVNEEFPRITNIGPSERIQQVSYSLDLSGPSTVPGYLTENLILQDGENA